ncbi:MAG TPA: hypothetical protein PKD00_00565 [Burkholderiales bacterium]|nr:hypothetical protein [Burkholderiales bacterium]
MIHGFKEWLRQEEIIENYRTSRFLGKKVLIQPFIEDKSKSVALQNLVGPSGRPLGETMYVLHNYWRVIAIGEITKNISVGDIVSIEDSMLIPPINDIKHPVGNSPDNPKRLIYGNPLDRIFPFRFQDDKFEVIIEPGKRTEEMLHYLPEDLIVLVWNKEELLTKN